ncbi:MAG TPA: hypothetical protein VGR35_22785 [Tepidisphaeraceae bacterium]|nr:hypothetical protein [Tepidisphaeraceae bacterium]
MVAAAVTVFGLAPRAWSQPVLLIDEQVIRALPMVGSDPHPSGNSVQLSPDGKTLLYFEPVGDAPPGKPFDGPAQLVIRRLAPGAGGEVMEFRPDIGQPVLRDLLAVRGQPFSPDGKLLLLPDYHTRAKPGGGEKRRPILACQTETGRIVRTGIEADIRYGRVDATNRLLLYLDGQAFSLETGKRVREFGYMGIVEAANPRVPLLLVNTGKEGTPDTPDRVVIWNLREDRLLATLPTNFDHPWTDDVNPEWTRDGAYAYFIDVVAVTERDGVRDRIRYAKVWNAKTGQLVGRPFRAEVPLGLGPLPGTMFLRRRSDEGATEILHHAESGAIAEIPEELGQVLAAMGDKIAFIKRIDGKPHLCVATLRWDLPDKPAPRGEPSPRRR